MADNNGNLTAAQVRARSVKQDDFNKNPYAGYGSVFQFLLPASTSGPGDLPPYWSPLRDRTLRLSITREAMWSSAIHIAVTKLATTDWRLDGRRVRYWQELLLAADNRQSFISFQEKQAKDFLLTDNGSFMEIIRATQGGGSRIVGIAHLDSLRCIRTGDPQTPVIYADRKGIWHELRDYQVVMMSDEPDTGYLYYDVGFCAASRAYQAIMKLSALETYAYEKISGKRPHRIYFVNASVDQKQIESAVQATEEQSRAKGYTVYMDAVIIPILDPSATASVGSIDLAGLPDGFEAEKERTEAKLTYAAAIGIDPNEIDPQLTNRKNSLGTGSQAQILEDKEKGRGIAAFLKKQAWLLNDRVLPDRVMFSTYVSDIVDQTRKAGLFKDYTAAIRDLVGNGIAPPIITPEQGKNVLVDAGQLSSEYLTEDLTADDTVRDTEKPSVTLDIAKQEPPDAALMLTEPKPVPAPAFGGKPAPNGNKPPATPKEFRFGQSQEKAFDLLVNMAEAQFDALGLDASLLTDQELVTLYIQHLPAPRQKEAKTKKLVEESLAKAREIYLAVKHD